MSDKVYGIDLGTTYSALARIDDLGQAVIVNNNEGLPTTPSAVFFESEDNVVIGDEAKRISVSDPDNSCLLIKREMGTDFSIEFFGKTWTPESISSLILRELVNAANQETGDSISKVVITVPAYFGTQEREATRQAGEIAGLEVVAIVAEPVAAALSLGIGSEQQQTIMVYDLGGGTFDTTVMKIGSGKVEVIVTDGNRVLGGADWDKALLDFIISKFAIESGISEEDIRFDEDFMTDMKLRAEDAKKSLTKKNETKILCRCGDQKANILITREDFENATKHLIQETIDICRRTMQKAKEKEAGLKLDRVLLVGGSSRMPQVESQIREQLGWNPERTDFDLAVAKGAAIYGQAAVEEVLFAEGESATESQVFNTEKKFYLGGASALEVKNVLARGVGIRFKKSFEEKEYISFFAHANDSIPLHSDPIEAFTAIDGQDSVIIALYEQAGEKESEDVENNRKLKEVDLPFAEPMPKGSLINIDALITPEGLVRLKAVDSKTGRSVELEATVSQLNQAEVNVAKSQVSAITLRS